MKRALVIGRGGLYGAYDAGVLVVLCKELGPTYFDAVYASSAGAITAPFFLSNQPDVIEELWRTVIYGRGLLFKNVFWGRPILDLDYFFSIVRGGVIHKKLRLDVERIFLSHRPFTCVLTDYMLGRAVYHTTTKEDIFDAMRASAAIPLLYGTVRIGEREYVDGGLTDLLPVEKAEEDGFEEIWAVWNYRRGLPSKQPLSTTAKLFSFAYPATIRRLMWGYEHQLQRKAEAVEQNKKIRAIRPGKPLPLKSFIDADPGRINATFDQGVRDAYKFLRSLN